MSHCLDYMKTQYDGYNTVKDVLQKEFCLVAHDISRAKYRENGIMLDGVRVFVNHPVMPGQHIMVNLEDTPSGKIVPAPGKLDIIYEDDDLIALNKPAGIVVHPSHGHYSDSLGNILAWYFSSHGEDHEIRSIGRLDRDTSGLILFGKNRTAVSRLVEQASDNTRSKHYLALASGIFEKSSDIIDAPIGRTESGNVKRIVREDGDPAKTYYEVIKQYDDFALIGLKLYTGRTHQIRVHMSYAGHPLLGDSLYGSGARGNLSRAALHSDRIEFLQPFTGEKISLEAPVPEDMLSLI